MDGLRSNRQSLIPSPFSLIPHVRQASPDCAWCVRRPSSSGSSRLASGRKATYYLDGKQVTLDPAGARLVAEGLLDLLAGGRMPDAVGGMSIGADPITAAVVTMSAVRGTPILGFMVRKESKGHGTNQYIEGPVQPGQTAAIVEDVVTTGGSSLLAIQRAEALRAEDRRRAGDHRPDGGRGRGVRPARLQVRQPAFDPRFRHRAAGRIAAFGCGRVSGRLCSPATSPGASWRLRA